MDSQTSTIVRLFTSTKALYERFDLSPTSEGARRILREEVGELCDASVVDETPDVLDEAADVIVTVVGLLLAHEYSAEQLEKAIARVIAKNDAKTLDTHEVNRVGKIARKEATQP